MSLPQAIAWRESLRKENKKLVVTNGCFDLIHRGHAKYLWDSRNLGDALLLLMNSDESVRALKGPSRPIVGESDRAYVLASLASVDAVVAFNAERCDAEFLALRPDIYVKGGDYSIEKINPQERDALLSAGADIRFIPFIPGFSTTEILEKITKCK